MQPSHAALLQGHQVPSVQDGFGHGTVARLAHHMFRNLPLAGQLQACVQCHVMAVRSSEAHCCLQIVMALWRRDLPDWAHFDKHRDNLRCNHTWARGVYAENVTILQDGHATRSLLHALQASFSKPTVLWCCSSCHKP